MKKLTNEEVLHVAKLGRLNLSVNEIEKFSYQLRELLDEIEKINEIEINNDDMLIAPETNLCKLSSDNPEDFLGKRSLIDNAPNKFDNFIEVAGVFDE